MSWSRRSVVLCLLASGCGFHPLYADRPGSVAEASVVDDLAAIRIEAIPDRIGQEVYNLLRDRLNPHGRPEAPKYILRVTLSEARDVLFISDDQTASRIDLTLKANYALTEAGSGQIVTHGISRSTASYDVLSVEREYATVVSKDAARSRAARLVCDEIRTRLALALSNGKTGN
ncbi:MAG: LPS assembly lipoprotein LptE [Dongiaceae bacterium]